MCKNVCKMYDKDAAVLFFSPSHNYLDEIQLKMIICSMGIILRNSK